MRGQRRQAMRRWCSQVRRLAILAVALAGFGGEAAAAALDAGQAGAESASFPGEPCCGFTSPATRTSKPSTRRTGT
jgi:hypothetical protein